MMKPTVAVVENGIQVQALMSDPKWRKRVDIWLALEPEAAWHLQTNGMDYAKLEDFYQECALCDQSEELFMRQVAWAEWVDRWLQQEVPMFKEYDIKPAHAHFCFLKRLFDQLEITTYQLRAFLKACHPSEILYFLPQSDDPTQQVWFLSSVAGRVLPILAESDGINATTIPVSTRQNQQSPVRLPLRRRIADHLPSSVRIELSLIQKLGMLEYLRLTPNRFIGENRILVLKEGYDVAPVLPELTRCDFRLHFHRRLRCGKDTLIRKTLTEQWNHIIKYEEFWAPIADWSEGISDLARPRLSYWWHQVIPEIWEVFTAARANLERKNVLAVVTASVGGTHRHRDIAVLLAARSLNIPVIMYQHGGFVGYCQHLMWDLTDMWQADYELCYGEGVRTYFEKRSLCYATPLAKPLPVGSARLDHVRSRGRKQAQAIRKSLMGDDMRPLVLYVPTVFSGPYRNLSCDSYSDVGYFKLQQRVIDVFRGAHNVRLVYKTFVGTRSANLVPGIVRQQLPDAVIVEDIRLTDLMWAVDGMIVDFPASALLEGLLTSKPFLVYADKYSLRMSDEAKALLRKRATLVETAEEFVAQVEVFLKDGKFAELSEPDDAFLSAYGTHLSDGLSAMRAANAIETIVRPNSGRGMAAR